jgi:GNAT superfamily N-acetyltransferase
MQSTVSDHRHQAAPGPPPFRLLVVSNETVTSPLLHDAIVGLAGRRRAEVTVVAPALNGRVRHWCSDEDGAREAARVRLEGALERLRADGVQAIGWVGDPDPMLAIEDALREGVADELLIATHPERRSNWLAHDLVERAVARFGIPTAHIVADDLEEYVVPREREVVAA